MEGVFRFDKLKIQASILPSILSALCCLLVKVLDLFSVCSLATALVQFLYAFTMGTFPFNAFLAGFFCCIGSFVLTGKILVVLVSSGPL